MFNLDALLVKASVGARVWNLISPFYAQHKNIYKLYRNIALYLGE